MKVFSVLQGRLKGVSIEFLSGLQGCLNEVEWVFPLNGASRHVKEVQMVLKGSFKDILRKIHGV